MRDATFVVEDDDEELLGAVVVSESTLTPSMAHLIVDVDAQDDGPAPVVLPQRMEEVVSVGDIALGCPPGGRLQPGLIRPTPQLSFQNLGGGFGRGSGGGRAGGHGGVLPGVMGGGFRVRVTELVEPVLVL